MQRLEVGRSARFFVSSSFVSDGALSETTSLPADPREVRFAQLMAPVVEGLGFELVRVAFGGGGRRTLQVMVERSDRATMTVDHCAEVSAALSAVLDDTDPVEGAFDLEVSSPGLDRPLTRVDDCRRFAGFEAQFELSKPLDGRRRFRGRLDGVEAGGGEATVVVTIDGGQVRLPWRCVKKAKLVLSDALLTAARRWAEEGRSP